jgi:uncharacterized membrane protein
MDKGMKILTNIVWFILACILLFQLVQALNDKELNPIGHSTIDGFEFYVLGVFVVIISAIVGVIYLIKYLKNKDFTTNSTALTKIKQAKEMLDMGVFSKEEYEEILKKYKKYLK